MENEPIEAPPDAAEADAGAGAPLNVQETERLPIKMWLSADELESQDGAIKQARNLAVHPFTEKWVGLMPDAHQGFGMPIGGVVLLKGAVVPYAVGNDIGCGVLTVRLDIGLAEISREVMQGWRERVHAAVPVGVARSGAQAAAQSSDRLPAPANENIARAWTKTGAFQLGTLGAGNHFIELQHDQSETLYLMIHSGSRGMGGAVCDFYYKAARRYLDIFRIALPDPQLAYLPQELPEYDQYLAEMRWCMEFARANRALMMDRALAALGQAAGRAVGPVEQFDCHHNFAQMESHYGKNYLVVRKGAVQARTGQRVAIPGSMGTASYLGRGLGNPQSFHTCSHGAGRLFSRTQANKAVTHEQALESMKHVVFGTRQGQYDEHPHAYKDIDAIMANQRDLVEEVTRLLPLAVVKG